jgi:hypothetical protein
VNVVVPATRPVADAEILIEPAPVALTALDATPAEVVLVPRPDTVPAPAALAKVTVRPESVVTLFSYASRTSTVSVREEPTASEAVELVNLR